MKLEQQVVSLELSQKLKELGVDKDSALIWEFDPPHKFGEKEVSFISVRSARNLPNLYGWIPAYTVAELGEILPWRSKKMDTVNNAELIHVKVANATGIKYRTMYCDEDKSIYAGIVADSGLCDTEADARAKMLVYLLENKLI